MRLRHALAVAGLCAASLAAQADTYQTYSVAASFIDNLPTPSGNYFRADRNVTGTATFDVTTGLFTDVTLPLDTDVPSNTGGGFVHTFSVIYNPSSLDPNAPPEFPCGYNAYNCLETENYSTTSFYFEYIDPADQITQPDGSYQLQDQYGTGEFGAPLAATPEPSSFALLGTGILGLGASLKRRRQLA